MLGGGCAAEDPHATADDPARDDNDGVVSGPGNMEPAATNSAQVGDAPSLPTPSTADMPALAEPVATRCVAPEGVSNAPTTVLETLDLINALPQPVTLPCFIESLERPLRLYATSGVLSAQPAVGRRSPRLFLFLGNMSVSIVPEGNGSSLLEFGELESDTRSLKAEVEFPVVGTLSEADAFDRLMYNETLTSCAFCHASEKQHEGITSTRAFVSIALRPSPFERVSLASVLAEHTLCDPEAEPDRCAMFRALFDHGEVVDGEFPEAMPTFY